MSSQLNSQTRSTAPVEVGCVDRIDSTQCGPPSALTSNFPSGRWQRFLQYARTVRHLEPVQIYTRLLPRLAARVPTYAPGWRAVRGNWLEPIAKVRAQTGPCRFRFLNLEREISSWNDRSLPQLWLYNLHYFEYAEKVLVDRWVAENGVGQGIGWDPYPTSLRIANWCKWILNGGSRTPSIALSLATQARWVERHLEHHLLANHLLANGKALLFAGCVLDCPDAARWREKGLEILARELPRQLLADGAHVERSPMYHSIVLEDLLDLCNLDRAFLGLLPDFSVHAGAMLRWLEWMTHPDGQISFFNDAAFGVAPPLSKLQAYARRLRIRSPALALGDSGYVRLEAARLVLIFDAAPLGPDYQPGHAHADALSFELSSGDRRIIVNSGTSTYDAGPIRDFERGTAAHNTVRIDSLDQSEMWAAFRVARRARAFGLKTDHRSFAEAAHDGYRRLGAKLTHRRRVTLTGDRSVIISDWIVGTGSHDIELFFHLAPGANPTIRFDPRLNVATVPTAYSRGFNQRVPNRTVVGRWSGPCPVHFDTRIDVS